MTDTHNPFTNPQLLHPGLADQIADAENWRQEHAASARVGAMGVAAAAQQAAQEHADRNRLDEVSPEFSDALDLAQTELALLLGDTGMHTAIDFPQLTDLEFKNPDWPRLSASFRAYELLDLQPQIVITPTGRDPEIWHALYSGLCDWQTENPPGDNNYRLETSDGGIWLHPDVRRNWDKLVPAEPSWQISVVAGTPRVTVGKVDRSGQNRDRSLPQRIEDILQRQPAREGVTTTKLDTYMSVEDYLMLQATRLHQDLPPVDMTTSTWLDGWVRSPSGLRGYPRGTVWNASSSKGAYVALNWNEPYDLDPLVGVRPTVRG